MATILNKQAREDIKHAIIHSAFSAREAALVKKNSEVAQLVYEACIPKDFQAAIKSLPAEWFVRKSSAYVSIDNKICYRLVTGGRSWEFGGPRAFPATFGTYGEPNLRLVTGEHDQVIADVRAACLDAESLQNEKDALSATLSTLLAGVRTVEKFQEVAPELAEYIPESVKKSSQRGGLPSVLVGDLVTNLMKAGLKVPKP